MHILTLATLFPNSARPNFGIFVERQTAALAARDGVEVTVISPQTVPPWPLSRHHRYRTIATLPEHQSWHGLDVYRPRFLHIPGIGVHWQPRLLARAVLPLVRRLHRERPFDLIDAEFFYPDGPAARIIAHALGLPYSVKARGADVHHWGQAPHTREMVVQAGRDANGLLAVSSALKAHMVALGLPADNITVHYTGCDQQRFAPQDGTALRAELGITGTMLICVGALIARKRQNLIIETLAILPDATLVLAGAGDAEASYRALAMRLGVSDRVIFAGSLPHDDLPRWLSAADVMVLPSQSEGLANAWVESLACGTPIVISDAGGALELLTIPVAGRIADANPQAIADAVNAVLALQPDPLAVRACVAQFNWDRNADELHRHFQRILGC
ncbi:glycosyltransferase [Blastomonas aquatica]|uniref:Glycosyl transferase family 1 n=1 Tax=Blastomonas aquatica TaxID=1510276 RepID=A0ABQ1JT14_9SPHN|nr:glycosyltransferase [Blastomonas aquatica]GGB73850.1 glycosyl transferase family 1 [Blastomonas aquatica]